MEQRKSNFFMVDNTVFYVGLKPRDIAVYCFLCRMENREKGYAYPTRRQIAYACGISKVETVDLALKELVRRGFIEKTHSYSEEHGYEANHYKIIKIDYDNLPIELPTGSQWTEGGIENGDTINKSLTKNIRLQIYSRKEYIDIEDAGNRSRARNFAKFDFEAGESTGAFVRRCPSTSDGRADRKPA